MPRNSGMGIVIASLALTVGFSLIWHIWWLAIVGFFGIITCLILRTTNDDTEYVITAAEIAALEATRNGKPATL